MTDKKVRLEQALDNKAKALEKSKSETEAQRAAKQAVIELNKLYIRKDELRTKLESVHKSLDPLVRARKRLGRNFLPLLLRLYGSISMIIPITKILMNDLGLADAKISIPYTATLVSFGLVCVGISFIMNMPKYADKRREKAIDRWEKDNPKYFELLKDKADLEKKLASVSKKIENATSGQGEGDIQE